MSLLNCCRSSSGESCTLLDAWSAAALAAASGALCAKSWGGGSPAGGRGTNFDLGLAASLALAACRSR
eukprot:9217199-Alexandrium_andersonii.AAC.1